MSPLLYDTWYKCGMPTLVRLPHLFPSHAGSGWPAKTLSRLHGVCSHKLFLQANMHLIQLYKQMFAVFASNAAWNPGASTGSVTIRAHIWQSAGQRSHYPTWGLSAYLYLHGKHVCWKNVSQNRLTQQQVATQLIGIVEALQLYIYI